MTENNRKKNCKLRKAKGQVREWLKDNKESLKNLVIVIGCIWLAITLLMWGFTQKTVILHQCSNVTDESFNIPHWWTDHTFINSTVCVAEEGWWNPYYDPPCRTEYVCNDIPHQEYYTLPEIFWQQLSFLSGAISSIAGWIMSHPVV